MNKRPCPLHRGHVLNQNCSMLPYSQDDQAGCLARSVPMRTTITSLNVTSIQLRSIASLGLFFIRTSQTRRCFRDAHPRVAVEIEPAHPKQSTHNKTALHR